MAWYSAVEPRFKYGDLPNDLDNFSCNDWMKYHNRLESAYGKAKAIEYVSLEVEKCGMFADVQNCKYDCNFVNFFRGKGYSDVGNIFSKTYCATVKVVDTVGNTVQSVGDTVGGIGNTVNKIITYKNVIAGGLIVGIYLYTKKDK